MEDGMEDFWYGMEWKISCMEWNCMEDFACYGRFSFHSIVCPAENTQEILKLRAEKEPLTHYFRLKAGRAVTNGGGAVVPGPPVHVWLPRCCIHPILHLKYVAPLMVFARSQLRNPGDGPAGWCGLNRFNIVALAFGIKLFSSTKVPCIFYYYQFEFIETFYECLAHTTDKTYVWLVGEAAKRHEVAFF